MELFDDLQFKDLTHIVQLGFVGQENKDLSTWEISRFIFDLNTYYYKYEIVNSIAISLLNGIKPEDLIILNESFMLNRQYGRMDTLNFNTNDVNQLYYIGSPYSMFPSHRCLALRYIFRRYREINEILFKYKIRRNSSKYVSDFYQMSIDNGIILVLEELTKYAIQDSSKHKKVQEISEKINASHKKILNELAGEEKTLEMELKYVNDPDQLLHLKNSVPHSFQVFFSLLNRLQRPIVIAFDKNSNCGRVLCRSQFNKSEKDISTFTLRSVQHNSPFRLLIDSGISIIAAFSDEKRKQELHDAEVELKHRQTQKTQTETEILQIDLLSKKIDLMKKIVEIESDPNYAHIAKLHSAYIQQQLSTVNDKITNNLQSLGDRTGLETDYMTTKINMVV